MVLPPLRLCPLPQLISDLVAMVWTEEGEQACLIVMIFVLYVDLQLDPSPAIRQIRMVGAFRVKVLISYLAARVITLDGNDR